ncbi:MAG: type II toxin-antitoxin system HicA family toxin [Desulfamplus sp.]|nr:type II toxin-antitoxin system HicA family toxin [Desulfamplus sp.]MBF0390577.1 type II toxin-antitoxin system HicA family toxin [Desulfamplus sp.]
MPKQPRMTAQEAVSMLIEAGYSFMRSKGSHRIYMKNEERMVIPFHAGKMLHPKIVKQVLEAVKK